MLQIAVQRIASAPIPAAAPASRARIALRRCCVRAAITPQGPASPTARIVFLSCLRRGYFALRRDILLPSAAKGCKNAAKNQRFLDFPCPIPTTVQKGSASNRPYSSYCCRSHAPRGDAPVCYRAAGLLRPYRRFPEYRRSSIDAPRRGRRPRRPVAFLFPHASGGNIPRPERGSLLAAAARQPFSLCRRRPYFFQQRKKYGKERRQKPSVFGGVFARFCRCWQKWGAPESKISPRPRARNIPLAR